MTTFGAKKKRTALNPRLSPCTAGADAQSVGHSLDILSTYTQVWYPHAELPPLMSDRSLFCFRRKQKRRQNRFGPLVDATLPQSHHCAGLSALVQTRSRRTTTGVLLRRLQSPRRPRHQPPCLSAHACTMPDSRGLFFGRGCRQVLIHAAAPGVQGLVERQRSRCVAFLFSLSLFSSLSLSSLFLRLSPSLSRSKLSEVEQRRPLYLGCDRRHASGASGFSTLRVSRLSQEILSLS